MTDFYTLFSSLCKRQQAKFQLMLSNFYHFFPRQTTQQTHSQTQTAFRQEMVTVHLFAFLSCRAWLPRYITYQISVFRKEFFSLNLLLQRNLTCLGAANKAIFFPWSSFPSFWFLIKFIFSWANKQGLRKVCKVWLLAKIWTIYVPNFNTSIYKNNYFLVLKIE